MAGDTSRRTPRNTDSSTTPTESTVLESKLTRDDTPLRQEVQWTHSTRLAKVSIELGAAGLEKLLTAAPLSHKSKFSETDIAFCVPILVTLH